MKTRTKISGNDRFTIASRSKLKEKTKKVEMLKLKKSLALDASHGRYWGKIF